jgi:SAM-dependent methyltransferase
VPYEQDEFDIVRRVLEAHGVTPSVMLDLGAGDGLATAAMIERVPVDRAVLVDFSEPMLAAARDRFNDIQLDVTVVEGDLFHPEWRDGLPLQKSYDLVLSRHAIHHLPDVRKRSLYGEILDLVRPGGMFVNIEHVKSLGVHYQEAFDRLMVERIHANAVAGTSFDDVLAAYRSRMDGELNILASVEDQCRWLRDVGFVDVDCPFKALELAVFCGRKPAA